MTDLTNEQMVADLDELCSWATGSPTTRTWVFFPADDEVECFISLRDANANGPNCIRGGESPRHAIHAAAQWIREQRKEAKGG